MGAGARRQAGEAFGGAGIRLSAAGAGHHRGVFTNSNLVALTWFPIRPAHYYIGKDSSAPTLVPPVGSGPYRVGDFDNDFVRYERVEDYWGRDIPVNRGRYNFDVIRYDVYRDATVAREAIRKGLFDIYFETDIRHWMSSYDIPAAEAGSLIMETRSLQKFIGLASAIVLNLDRERFRDVRVREALTLALDFEWQNRAFQYGSQSRRAQEQLRYTLGLVAGGEHTAAMVQAEYARWRCARADDRSLSAGHW